MNISKKDYSVHTVLMWRGLQHDGRLWWCKISLNFQLLFFTTPLAPNFRFEKLSRARKTCSFARGGGKKIIRR